MRRTHFIVGLATVAAFVLSGGMMRLHHPPARAMDYGPRMMLIARHMYLLGGGLVNLALGMYLRMENGGWRKHLQAAGSVLLVIAPVPLLAAFLVAPEPQMDGRTQWAAYGWFALLGGVMLHFVARTGAGRIDTTASEL